MPRALRKCPGRPGKHCINDVRSGRCGECKAEAEAERGTAAERGYSGPGHEAFRKGVLEKHPWCRIRGCRSRSTDADHFPRDRDELERLGFDPNNPAHGRGLCGYHHRQETARRQPGGWNRR